MLNTAQVTALAFLALQLSSLVRYSIASQQAFDIQLFSEIVSSVSALGFCVLSFVEQRLSATPSTLLVLYMLACALGHASELLILPLKHDREALYFLIVHVFLELALVILECQNKDSVLLLDYQLLTPEEPSSVLGRTFFWWINLILMTGHRSILTDANLPRTGQKLSSSKVRRDILRSWDQRGLRNPSHLTCYIPMLIPTKVKPEQIKTLPYVLFDCFKRPLLLAILPRLFLIIFRYSQGLLINIAVKCISNVPKASASRDENGRWLIVGALIVYVGMAVSIESPHFSHRPSAHTCLRHRKQSTDIK
jgi:ATP-binding cassette subfamily C (CFTR/MRP) protein 1